MKKYLKYIVLLLFIASCSQKAPNEKAPTEVNQNSITEETVKVNSCEQLPATFNTYEQAKKAIKNAEYAFSETANTTSCDWITSASYYSCDGKTGYFFMGTETKEYVFKDMPLEIWKGFVNASSMGSYYNKKIKKKYQLYVLEEK